MLWSVRLVMYFSCLEPFQLSGDSSPFSHGEWIILKITFIIIWAIGDPLYRISNELCKLLIATFYFRFFRLTIERQKKKLLFS